MLGRNILAVYPHRRKGSEVRFTPPIGIEYVMAAVQDLVDEITIVDMRQEDEYDLNRFIDAKTDCVCISLNWRPSGAENGVVPELELINRLPADMLTIVGGRWATLNVDAVFEQCPNVDVVVKGDGEETLRALALSSSPADVDGLSWRVDGVVHHNAVRRFAPLSETIYPNRALRRYVYRATTRGIDLGVTMDSLLSSRGCPFNCKFCSYNTDTFGRRRPWEPRSPESVVAELRTVDAEVVLFTDNNFCVDMDRVEAICDLLIRENIRKIYAVEARIEIARRPDVLAKMARAGFRIIMLGLESACDESLELLNKGFTIADVRAAFEVLRRFRFVLAGFFIVGNIGESQRDMLRMSGFAREIGVDFISLSYLRVDPGSSLEEVVRQTPGYHVGTDRRARVYSDSCSFRDLRVVKRALNRDFYFSTHMLRSLRRGINAGLVTPRQLASVLRSAVVLALRRLLRKRLGSRLELGGDRR